MLLQLMQKMFFFKIQFTGPVDEYYRYCDLLRFLQIAFQIKKRPLNCRNGVRTLIKNERILKKISVSFQMDPLEKIKAENFYIILTFDRKVVITLPKNFQIPIVENINAVLLSTFQPEFRANKPAFYEINARYYEEYIPEF